MQKKYGDRLSATHILSIWLDCNLNFKCVLAKLLVSVCLLNSTRQFSHMYYVELKPWPPQLVDIGYAPHHAAYTNLLYNVISNHMHVEDTTYLSFLFGQQESIKQGKVCGICSSTSISLNSALQQVKVWAELVNAFCTSGSSELELVVEVQTQCLEDAKLMKLFPEITFQGQFKNNSRLEGLFKMDVLKINLALIPLEDIYALLSDTVIRPMIGMLGLGDYCVPGKKRRWYDQSFVSNRRVIGLEARGIKQRKQSGKDSENADVR